MSGIRNQGHHRQSDAVKQPIHFELVTAISQTGVVAKSFTPGYKFRIARITSYCRVKAGTVTAVVKVGGRTAATIAFTTATELAATLSTTLANLIGSATEAITIEYTTDGSGVLTNGNIVVVIRPYPLNGELGRTAP